MNERTNDRPTNPVQILVVDDDPSILRFVSRALNDHFGNRADVVMCQDVEEATMIFQRQNIEIVLTDLNLENMNGFHLLKAVKSRRPLTQVVIMTATQSRNAIRSAFALGADDYLTKPLTVAVMVDCIEFMLNRLRRWESEIGDLNGAAVS